jgi:hypothetical protein
MKYAVEVDSGVMIYMIYVYARFINIGSGIQKVDLGDTNTYRQHGDSISLLLFF